MGSKQTVFRSFPFSQALLLLGVGVALYLLLGGLLLLANHNAARFRNVFMQEGSLVDTIRLEAVRTHGLALLAAATGEQVFVARCREHKARLESAMAALRRLRVAVPDSPVSSLPLEKHLPFLLATQSKVLSLVETYSLIEAWALLRGMDYEMTFDALARCLNDCDAAVEAAADASLRHQEAYTTAALWSIALFTPVFALLGLSLVQRGRRIALANRQAQAALTESERRFRGTFEQAAVGMAHVGLDGTFLRVNDRFCALMGYGAAELTSTTFAAITHPDDLDAGLASAGQLLAGEIACYAMDKRYVTKGGGQIWATLTVTLVRDDAGTPLFFISVVQDISARKTAEAVAEENAQTVRALLDATSDRVLLVEASGRILAANAAAARGLGLEPGRLVGRFFHEVFPRELALSRLAKLHAALATGEPQRFTDERDGKVFDNIAAPLPRPGGVAASAALFARDATDIIRARQAAEAASAAKTNFLANISHELRTPLNAILGMAQVLAGSPLAQEQQQCLDDIEGASRSLMGLVDDLIELSDIEAGIAVVTREPFVLSSLLRALDAIGTAATAAKGLAFDLKSDDGLPPLVLGDGDRLRDVMERLIGNAVKFTAQGGVTVTVSCARPCVVEADGVDAADVTFAVRDTGIGVPRGEQRRIFELFTQADGSSTRRFGGVGLGLAISSRLVRLMGGEISLESEPGQGSVFYFTLRFAVPELPPEEPFSA